MKPGEIALYVGNFYNGNYFLCLAIRKSKFDPNEEYTFYTFLTSIGVIDNFCVRNSEEHIYFKIIN